MNKENVLKAMNSGNGNSFLAENSVYSHSQNDILAYEKTILKTAKCTYKIINNCYKVYKI